MLRNQNVTTKCQQFAEFSHSIYIYRHSHSSACKREWVSSWFNNHLTKSWNECRRYLSFSQQMNNQHVKITVQHRFFYFCLYSVSVFNRVDRFFIRSYLWLFDHLAAPERMSVWRHWSLEVDCLNCTCVTYAMWQGMVDWVNNMALQCYITVMIHSFHRYFFSKFEIWFSNQLVIDIFKIRPIWIVYLCKDVFADLVAVYVSVVVFCFLPRLTCIFGSKLSWMTLSYRWIRKRRQMLFVWCVVQWCWTCVCNSWYMRV